MSQGALKNLLTVGCAVLVLIACKKKEEPAVIEELPSSTATETDTTAALAEEPALQQVGKEAPAAKHGKTKAAKTVSRQSPKADQAGFSESGRYVVQVSIFKTKNQAAGLVEKLANAGFPAYVAEVENPTPELAGTWHRVRIGNFATIGDAKAFGDNTLSGMGYQYWVDNKKNDGMGGDGSYSAPAEEPAPKPKRAAKVKPSEPAPVEATPTPSFEATPTEPTALPSEPAAEPVPAELPGAAPAPAAATPPPAAAPADTGKVNLDEW